MRTEAELQDAARVYLDTLGLICEPYQDEPVALNDVRLTGEQGLVDSEVLEYLQQHHLIKVEGVLVGITPAGLERLAATAAG